METSTVNTQQQETPHAAATDTGSTGGGNPGLTQPRITSKQWWRRNWFIMLPLAVYLATYAVVFPGIDSVDANWQRQMFADWTFSKQHSVLSTFVFGIIGGDQLWLCNLTQSIIFAACIITALSVLAPRVSQRALLIASLAWSFYPLFPAYAVSCVKDVLCAGFTLLLCVEVFAIIDSKGALLRNPWFVAGLTLTLFVTNEYRKNNFLFIGMIVLFLLIRYRSEWKRLLAMLLAFAALTVAWGAYCDYGLKAEPAATTEMLGVPLMQVSYIYYEDLHGVPQQLPAEADAYFQAVRSQDEWAANYEKQPLVVMDNKIGDLTSADLGEFLGNWASLCFANFGTCVKAYVLFEGSLINPLQVTDDQYSILGGVLHMDKATAGQSSLAWVPRVVFNLAVIDWILIALAVFAYRRGMRELLPLFLIPLGIAISLMLAALAVQIRLMLGAIILIPFLAALILGRTSRHNSAAAA